MPSPYKTHPLYWQRRCLLINAVVAVLLAIPAIFLADGFWLLHIILLIGSAWTSWYDLFKWSADESISDTRTDRPWPRKGVMIADALLTLVLMWTYLLELSTSSAMGRLYYNTSFLQLQTYLGMTALVASLLHGYCFWKEFMVLKRSQWLCELPQHVQDCLRRTQRTNTFDTITTIDSTPQDGHPSRHSSNTLNGNYFPGAAPRPAAAAATTISAFDTEPLSVPASSHTFSPDLITPDTDSDTSPNHNSPAIPFTSSAAAQGYGTMQPHPHSLPSKTCQDPTTLYYNDHEVVTVTKKKKAKKNGDGK